MKTSQAPASPNVGCGPGKTGINIDLKVITIRQIPDGEQSEHYFETALGEMADNEHSRPSRHYLWETETSRGSECLGVRSESCCFGDALRFYADTSLMRRVARGPGFDTSRSAL
jgi:hypothetical protein